MPPINRNPRPWRAVATPFPDDPARSPHAQTTTYLDRLLTQAWRMLTIGPYVEPGEPPRRPLRAVTVTNRADGPSVGQATLSLNETGQVEVSGAGAVREQVAELLRDGVSTYSVAVDIIPEQVGVIPDVDTSWRLTLNDRRQARYAAVPEMLWEREPRRALRTAAQLTRRPTPPACWSTDCGSVIITHTDLDGTVTIDGRPPPGRWLVTGTGPIVAELGLEPTGHGDTLRFRQRDQQETTAKAWSHGTPS
jgi:hypothetical protein